eukprot:gene10637-14284_t
MKVTASAPGKVILFGEHAVVYGVTAVAAALTDLRIFTEMEVEVGNEPSLNILFADMSTEEVIIPYAKLQEMIPQNLDPTINIIEPDLDLIKILKDHFSNYEAVVSQGLMAVVFLVANVLSNFVFFSAKSLRVVIKSHGLPIGAGLGSSASFAVATAGCCFYLREQLANGTISITSKEWIVPNQKYLELINKWAYSAEMIMHGSPSGLDNTTSCFGGLLKYNKLTNEFHTINSSYSLNMLLVNTKVPRSTKQLVSLVKDIKEHIPDVVDSVFNSIEKIVQTFLQIVKKEDNFTHDGNTSENLKELDENMARLIILNHHLLCGLQVGHPALTKVVELSASEGFACKLTGAGGGGCAITLLPSVLDADSSSRLDNLVANLRSLGFETFQTQIAGDGVRWHMI